MVTESYLKMMSDVSTRSMLNNPDFGEDLGQLIREQRRQQQEVSEIEKELNVYRSGSAPPTVEGSLNAVGGLFEASGQLGVKKNGGKVFETEEELRADPAYVNYYYSNVNLNPRLPPPLLSKEDWRFAQRLQGGRPVGGIGDRRRVGSNDSSLFSVQPGYSGKEEGGVESGKGGADWSGDGLIGLPGLGLGSRQKSIAEMIQDDMVQPTPVSRHPSRPASRNAFDGNAETIDSQFSHLSNELTSNSNKGSISALQNASSSASHSYASALGASLSRSTTPDPQHVARAPSPRIPPVGVGRGNTGDKRSIGGLNSMNGISSNLNESADLVTALSNLNLAKNGMIDEDSISSSQIQHNIDDRHNLFNLQGDQNHIKKHPYLNKSDSGNYHSFSGHANNPGSPSMMGQLGSGNMPPLYESAAAASAFGGIDTRGMGQALGLGPNMMASAAELQNLRAGNHSSANALQMPLLDPLYLQYLRSNEYAAAQIAALGDPAMNRDGISNSYMDLLELQKAYLGALLSPQKSQYLGKSSGLNHGYYGSPTMGVGMSYPGSPLGGPLLPNSPVGLGNPSRHGERNMRFSSMRNLAGSVLGAWHSNAGGKFDEGFGSSLLDEFKSNKTKCFELSEIAGHVVEFSADQYGSRFIQQKLETASAEEKDMVFNEIMPQALSLMTDVFGNYVIQKFFEHGSASQIRELAEQLTGHVLTLSLQMYGCRVIQKAIEVVDLDQQTKMVKELDGHVMRCVRDQNGNHVIQKCIECIPEDAIQFIVSTFYDQVVMLSTHPYGCRVIQRILEHCHDPKTQRIMMDEIMQSVCMLAQDQYGNYVVQHVLEHGKPHERSAIIKKLTGQIVQMSQQKFASNVIEKCLAFGTPEERETLISEMLGSTEDYEPLQVMMKDQFANYVVQKVLETCDDQQLELILNRIKVHLNALKKYTYGKHIVARVEKLVAAGERRISIQTGNSA